MSDTLDKDGGGGKPPQRRGRRPGPSRGGMAGRVARPAKSSDAGPAGPAAQPEAKPKARSAARTGKAKAGADEAPPVPKRRAAGFLQAGALAQRPIRDVSSRRGFAEIRVLTDWPEIAGPGLSAACRPLRISYSGAGMGAALIVEADGARATEVEMQGPRIVERVNAHYGYRAISRVKVVQAGRAARAAMLARAAASQPAGEAGLSEEASPFRRGPATDPATDPTPDAAPDIERIEDPRLREAMARLGRNLARRRGGGGGGGETH